MLGLIVASIPIALLNELNAIVALALVLVRAGRISCP
jgi:hypothetical protein